MDCVGCGSVAVTERPAQGYRRFRCERSDGVLDRASLPTDIIAFVEFCRLRYRLTLRDLSEIMLLRGFTVSHECIRQWEAKLLPAMGEALRKRRHGIGRSSGQSWYADETHLKVQGRSCYLYRIDRDGNLIDTMLSGTRDNRAAQRFFRSARSVVGHRVIQPDVRVGTGRWDYTNRAAAFAALDKNTADFTTGSQARAWLEDYHAGRAGREIWHDAEGKWRLVAQVYPN